ncbi:zinc knuckle CX2CX4HX4C containing protein, partial [Tanacetum coccineum]
SSYDRSMIDLRVDEELKDTIVVAMPKLVGEGFKMCIIHVEYEWKPPRCSSCTVFGHVLNECPKKIVSDVVKNLNNPRQATRGVQQDELSRQEISNLNPFDALNSIENDDDLGKHLLVDDNRKPLPNVVFTVRADSATEVEEVFDEHTTFMASTVLKCGRESGYGTNSL